MTSDCNHCFSNIALVALIENAYIVNVMHAMLNKWELSNKVCMQ